MSETVNMPDKKRLEHIKTIEKFLNSNDEDVVLKSIAELKEYGRAESLPILIDLLNNESQTIVSHAKKVLLDLKITNIQEYLFSAINDQKYIQHRPFLISVLWEANIECESYLEELIRLALRNDFEVAMEVMTVIDNMAGTFHDEEISNLLMDIDEFMDENPDDAKAGLLLNIKEMLHERRAY